MKKIAALILTAALTFTLVGCSLPTSSNTITAEDGYAEGRMGDVVQTAWYTFTINSAYVTSQYESYSPSSGNELLVVNITIKNTFNESIPMFDTDFQAQWNDDAYDAYAWPVETNGTDVLPSSYNLGVNQSVTGLLIYEVPAGNKDFSISTVEYYANDTEGDTFFVFFTADRQ